MRDFSAVPFQGVYSSLSADAVKPLRYDTVYDINLTFVYMSEGVSAQVGVPESGIVIQHVIGAFSPPP